MTTETETTRPPPCRNPHGCGTPADPLLRTLCYACADHVLTFGEHRKPDGQPDPEPDGLLSTKQAAEAAGVTFRQLDYWDRKGWIIPTVEATGSGNRRRYHPDTVTDAMVLGQLARLLSPRNLRLAVSALELWRDAGRPDDRIIGTASGEERLWTEPELLAEIRTGASCIAIRPPKDT